MVSASPSKNILGQRLKKNAYYIHFAKSTEHSSSVQPASSGNPLQPMNTFKSSRKMLAKGYNNVQEWTRKQYP